MTSRSTDAFSRPIRAVVFDRDGTLNVDRPDYVKSLDELEMLPGVADAIGRISRAGYRVLVASVQACVGKGLVSPSRLEEINRAIEVQIRASGGRIDGWYICPHLEGDGCTCRKPLPGLIEQARRAFDFDPAATWVIGDAERDIGMAKAAGCKAALVLTGKGEETARRMPELPTFASLSAFADALLA